MMDRRPRSRVRLLGIAALDDYLDALAALVAVMRLVAGTARRLPLEGEDRDGRGLAIEIVY